MEKLESVQYSAALAITGAWKGTSRDKFHIIFILYFIFYISYFIFHFIREGDPSTNWLIYKGPSI